MGSVGVCPSPGSSRDAMAVRDSERWGQGDQAERSRRGAVVVCEKPRIAPLRATLRESIASVFDIPVSRVNVKGKTAEGMGPIGRGEGIDCQAVALVERGPSQL